MKVTTEEIAPCEVLMSIEIEPAQEQDLLKKAAQRIAREVNIPGFRRGKAPFNTIVRRFGWEVIQQEALEQSTEKVITAALEEAGLKPYAQMQLDEINWNPLVIKVKVPTQPNVKLASNYRDIRLDYEPVEVTDEDVEEALKALQEQNATWTPVERPSQLGDLISMTVTERAGDQILAENEAVEYELIAPDESEEAPQLDLTTPLLGLSAGESKTFTITYPEDFENERYAGKEITFSVEVSGVKVKELDPLDDDFARQVSDLDTLEELKQEIRENMQQRRERQRDFELGQKVLEKLIAGAEVLEWPKALEEENIDDELRRYEHRLKHSGMTLNSYLKMQNKTQEELREEIRAEVVARLKRGLVLSEVAELEKLDVSQSEILEQAKAIADYTGGHEQIWTGIMASEAQQNMLATDLLSNKAIYRLAAIAKGEAPEPGVDGQAEALETAGDEAQSENDNTETQTGQESAEEPVTTKV